MITLNKNNLLRRPRVNALLAQAVQNPLTILCAGMGCGKTCAVYDFTQLCKIPVMWLQFSDTKNPGVHFWNMFVRAIAQTNALLAKKYKKLGLPDTADKLSICFDLRSRMQPDVRRLYVFDDFHFAKDPAVLNFIEQALLLQKLNNTSVLLISREFPQINISSLMVRNQVCMITEEELNFTKNELHQFLLQQGLNSETNSLSKIYQDTKGWAFSINFVTQILKKMPGYAGYASNAIKQNIYQLIETEIWKGLSEQLKVFFLRLSLATHFPMELVNMLAKQDKSLLAELQQQNAFTHYDTYMDSYRIHSLFLDFLHAKQAALTDDVIRDTYKTIADWCVQNDFIVDALSAYEKINDYQSIVSILFSSPLEFIQNTAHRIVDIFNSAPAEVFDCVDFSAVLHVHATLCTGEFRKTSALLHHYEEKYLLLPKDNAFRNRMLGGIYYIWGVLRMALCTTDDCLDFDTYFIKQRECLKDFPVAPKCWYQHPNSLWTGLNGSIKAGAPQEYLNTLIRAMPYIRSCVNGSATGIEDLCQGELLLYQGDIHEAEFHFAKAIRNAQEYRQYEIVFRALLYIMRLSVVQGDYAKLGLALTDAERQLTYDECSVRFSTYDIVLGWYYSALGQQEKMASWLKEKFTYRSCTNSLENLGNYIKTKYCYLAGKYADLLDYLKHKRQPGTILFERIESLAMEACVYWKMNNANKAISVLHEAYEVAHPNGIVLPFIELGKDTRALIDFAPDCPACAIPHQWLQSIRQKASAYFRNQTLIIDRYKKTHGISNKDMLSPREIEILHDMQRGLARSEVAIKRNVSINTVKQHISNIYNKLGARNRADAFRIAAAHNLLSDTPK